MHIGYCGNVHPGRTIEEVKANLTKFSLSVKQQVRPDETMGIGLWLSATAARELDDERTLLGFRDWLAENGLLPFTLNGFPFGDFHQEVVKHDVYLPTWAETERLEYTVRLAEILNVILPDGIDGTISTLPLGWPTNPFGKSNLEDKAFLNLCAQNLRTCSERLDSLSSASGRDIFVCIEPEPGCILDTADDVVDFFDGNLMTKDTDTNVRILNHIGVCHDVCHSAVMFEEQSYAVSTLSDAAIRIGKVQVSSAVAVDFDSGTDEEKLQKLEQVKKFSEPRYLHQTSVRVEGETEFYEDLHLAIDSIKGNPAGQWRVHFHVPIYLGSLDSIDTTQSEIRALVESLKADGGSMPHFEVETYAWNVLPEHLREIELADGIAKEIEWFDELIG